MSKIGSSDWIDCWRSFKVVNRTIDELAYCLRMIVNTQRNVRLFVVNVSIATCEIVADRMNDDARPLVRFLDNDIRTFGEGSERFAFGYEQIEVGRQIGIARSDPNKFSINLSRPLFPDDEFEPLRISIRYRTRIERAKRSN